MSAQSECQADSLCTAARAGDVETLRGLLSTSHNVNQGDHNQQTPLHHAALAGHADCVKLLLAHGATVASADQFGARPLSYAMSRGHAAVVELLRAAAPVAALQPRQLPRVLIVARRHVRKNKYVDFVGEYHLDLLMQNGVVPIIVPRVTNISQMLDAFEPFHGVLLCEGEDVQPHCYASNCSAEARVNELDEQTLENIRSLHPSDTEFDPEKDKVELALVHRCLERGVPYFGICRGGQLLNVAMGGTLWVDVETFNHGSVKHVDYADYDGLRHPISVVPDTPLYEWFGKRAVLSVNSYHHQGHRTLGPRLRAMAHSDDGLAEAVYDPSWHDPANGKFRVGLQFHPERMQANGKFDYDECPVPYEHFCRAVRAFSGNERSSA